MEAVSLSGAVNEELREAAKPAGAAADSKVTAEEAGQSTVCCSSEDEYNSTGVYPSDDERQDSDAQPQEQQPQQQQQQQPTPPPPAAPKVTVPELQLPRYPPQTPQIQTAGYTYTISNLEDVTVEQQPSSWLKPRIKIDGPEVFHGLLRANDDNLPAHETVPSTETFVSFQGQWRVVTSTGTSSYIGSTMNPYDPSTATYPLPITYKVADDAVVVRETATTPSRAESKLSVFERMRRFFCTSVAEYMQS
ncbi:hypothetical protein, conserved [Eimeria brunetti]|uniref:Uncharacterized protein n=1 Tax=Eimeria brunetti TaxID=51314 RepID=U6LL02_9EIME|nr:hypothetical protein, conserved [Eimeria brunetti]